MPACRRGRELGTWNLSFVISTSMSKTLTITHHSIPMGPYKLRPVADLIRGVSVTDALVVLKVTPRAAAQVLAKKLQSTASSAIDHSFNPERLLVKSIYVDQQMELKRQRIRSRGRSAIMRKRSSSVTIELAEITRNQQRETSNAAQTTSVNPELPS